MAAAWKLAESCGLWVLVVVAAVVPAPGEALGTLNLHELSELKYGIEIGAEPVMAGQSKASDVVTISSKYKQKYECRLPAAAVKIHQEKDEDPQSYTGLGVSELLKPMEAAPCLIKTKDWWTYKFCYGKHIQQYHMEDSEIKGDVLYLGYYQSAFDWDNETAKASKQHKLKRYHSQTYVNGSKCNLNGKPREAEVRFLCEEGSRATTSPDVDEPQSCSYVLTVHTTRICNHRSSRPPSTAHPPDHPLPPSPEPCRLCGYVKAQGGNDRDTSSAALDSDGNVSPAPPPPESDSSDDGDFWAKVLRGDGKATQMPDQGKDEEPVMKTADDHLTEFKKKIHFKVIRNPGDLVQFIHELKDSARKHKEKASPSEEAAQETPPKSEPASEAERSEEGGGQEEEEEDLLGKFEKELEDIFLPKSEMAKLKEEVKSEMEKEFDNIIDEVEDELETEGLKGEFDRKQASKSLASTLNKLIDKLDPGPKKGDKEEEPPQPEEEEEVPAVGEEKATEDSMVTSAAGLEMLRILVPTSRGGCAGS
uniref:Uncharacterized protein n=1 Tax=Sphaerodactylus townsendi TaxID=933632 RepID=A0ACB8EPF6_9SAUR